MRLIWISLPLLALAACATTAQSSQSRADTAQKEAARLTKLLSGFTPGKPQSCVTSRDLRGPEAFGETSLIFRAGRNVIYRNETRGSCRGIARGEVLITQQYSSELCAGDIARTADLRTGFQSGSCVLGDFVPYRRTSK